MERAMIDWHRRLGHVGNLGHAVDRTAPGVWGGVDGGPGAGAIISQHAHAFL